MSIGSLRILYNMNGVWRLLQIYILQDPWCLKDKFS
jgi:hypothetical protein